MNAKPQKLGRLPFIILAVLTAILIGVAVLLQLTVVDTRTDLETTRRNYEKMYAQKMEVLALPIRGSVDPPANVDTTLPSFFDQVSRARGILDGQRPVPFGAIVKNEIPETNWTKYTTQIQFRGTKDQPLDRRRVVEFMNDLEKTKYLKITRIILRIPDGQYVGDAQISISYYKRKE